MFLRFLIANTFFAMVTAGLIYYFLKINFKLTSVNKKTAFFITCFGILNGTLSSLWSNYYSIPQNLQFVKPIILLVLSVVLIKYMLKIEWAKTILSFCIVSVGMAIGNFLAPMVLKVSVQDTKTNFKVFLFVNILIYFFTLVFVIFTPLIKNISKVKNLKPVAFLLTITFVIIASNFGIHYASRFDIISFLAVFISSFAYLVATLWYISKYQRYELQLEEQKQQAFYNDSLGIVLQDLQKFKHDQNNHLAVIYNMLKMQKNIEAYAYLQEIVNGSGNLTNTAIFNIKNAGLFGIISSKMDKAHEFGVSLVLKTVGVIDSIENVKISELCEVVGIHLDNAIEAAYASTQKQVEIITVSNENGIDITIKNSCSEIPIMNKIKLNGYSTKGIGRGNGLSIVDRILSGYKNILNVINFNESSMQFTQTLKIKKGI